MYCFLVPHLRIPLFPIEIFVQYLDFYQAQLLWSIPPDSEKREVSLASLLTHHSPGKEELTY